MLARLKRWWSRLPVRIGVWVLFWTLLGLLDGVQAYAGLQMEGRSVEWQTALQRGLESHWIWAVVGWGVLWWAERFPLEQLRAVRWVAIQMAGCVMSVALYDLCYAALLNGRPSLQDGTIFAFWKTMRKLAIWYTVSHVIMYWTIVVAHAAWRYYGRYREREQRAAELQAQLTQARLDALHMQLNPHFLFNSLNTITALVHEDPEAADRMITRLGELLRTSLDRAETQEIPLSQEFAFLERYLEIEQARFGDRLRVEFAAGEDTRPALVPALILQPLVENAVRHGVEAREENTRIRIGARRVGEALELCVEDNGPGLPNGAKVPGREGIGLSNTRSRLQHLYGDGHRLELRPRPEGGLEVLVRLPYRVNGLATPTVAV